MVFMKNARAVKKTVECSYFKALITENSDNFTFFDQFSESLALEWL